MNLSKTQKIVLLIFTVLPFLIGPYIIFQIFNFVVEASQYGEYEPDAPQVLAGVLGFVGPIILVSILTFALLVLYIIHAAGNKAIDPTERIIWIILFVLFGIIAFPIYFFLRIWNTTA